MPLPKNVLLTTSKQKRKAENTSKSMSKPSNQSDQVDDSRVPHCESCSCFHHAKEGDRFCAHCKKPSCHGALLLKPGNRFPVFSPYKGEEARERAAKRMELNAQKRAQLEQERKLLLKAMEIATTGVVPSGEKKHKKEDISEQYNLSDDD